MTTIADTFDRADSASTLGTASDGGTWTVRGNGTLGITSNRAYQVSQGGSPLMLSTSFATRDAGGTVIDFTVDSVRANTGGEGYLLIAYDPGTGNGYVYGYTSAGSGTIATLQRVVANVALPNSSTLLNPSDTSGMTAWNGSSSTLRITFNGGGQLKFYQDGNLRWTYTDPTPTNYGTWVGLGSTGGALTDKWDNFTATGTLITYAGPATTGIPGSVARTTVGSLETTGLPGSRARLTKAPPASPTGLPGQRLYNLNAVGGVSPRNSTDVAGVSRRLNLGGTGARTDVAAARVLASGVLDTGAVGNRGSTDKAGANWFYLAAAGATGARVSTDTAGAALAAAILLGATGARLHTGTFGAETRTPPANDNEADAYVITGLSGTYAPFSTVAATLEVGERALPSTVTVPAGTVWFRWSPDIDGIAIFQTSSFHTGLSAFVEPQPDDLGWRTIQWPGDTSYFAGSYVKLYRVHVPVDTDELNWTSPPLPSDDVTGLINLYLYFLEADPGDITASTFTPSYDTYISRSNGNDDSGSSIGPLTAGDYWIIAQQYPSDFDGDFALGSAPGDPVDSWDPGVDIGTFTDLFGESVPFPFDSIVQVVDTLVAIPGPLTPGHVLGEAVLDLQWYTRAGETYDIRVYPTDALGKADNLSLTWETQSIPINLTLPTTTLAVTPTSLPAFVAAETPGETLTFTLLGDPTVRVVAVTGSDGSALVDVPIDFMADGVYELLVVSDSGRTATALFVVAATVVVTPPDDTDSVVPDIPPAPVNRWVLHDLVTDVDWTFPINPLTADSVMMPRYIDARRTTAVDGASILFEGAQRSKAWQFTGHVLTLADRLELESWAAKPYRVILTDDFGRHFIVKITSVAMTPVRDFLHPEHHTYQASALLYGRTP